MDMVSLVRKTIASPDLVSAIIGNAQKIYGRINENGAFEFIGDDCMVINHLRDKNREEILAVLAVQRNPKYLDHVQQLDVVSPVKGRGSRYEALINYSGLCILVSDKLKEIEERRKIREVQHQIVH